MRAIAIANSHRPCPVAQARPVLLCLTLLVIAPAPASAAPPMSFQTLAQRLPAASNAVVAINVTKVLESPYARREHWGTNAADAWAKQPVMIPPGATRLIMAAAVKPSTMDSYWELSLIEMSKMPSVKDLAAAEGGHIDRVWDRDAAYSPINAYFVPIEPTVLASITPAERSEVVRWVRQPVKPEGVVTSTYIQSVIAVLNEKTDIVMAMDLDGAIGVPAVRKFLDDHDVKEIPGSTIDATAEVLAGMKGITLDVLVGETVTGRASVQFERDAGLLKECAKPVMVAVLKRLGMRTDDVQDWKFSVEGKQVSMQGSLSAVGLRELLGLVQTPIPAATTVAASPPPGGPAQAQTPADPAEASRRYYQAVAACVRNLREGVSVQATATAARNAAKRIDQLPILRVDPALVQWGGAVSTRLKQAVAVLSVGQSQINARVAGVKDPEYVSYTYDHNGYVNGTNYSSLSENAKLERRQQASQQRSETYQQALMILNEIAETTPKIRAEMVAKYNVEF